MTFTTIAAPRAYAGSPKRGPVTQLLEDERWLAILLLLPTLLLLGLFIAYPFFKGVELSVTDTKVGVPGQFVGLQNFEKIWNDGIFHVAVWNTCFYTSVTTVFKLALGLWLALLLNNNFKGKAFTRAFILLPFIIPTVLSTLAWKWMFDPTFSVINWMLFRLGVIHGRINWLGDPNLALISVIIVNVWRGVPFYAISLLAGLADDQPRIARGRGNRRGQSLAALSARDLAVAVAGHPGYRPVLGDSDLCRLPAGLCADGRRAGERHPAFCHLRLPARHRHGPVEPRRDDFARRLPGAAARRHRPAACISAGWRPSRANASKVAIFVIPARESGAALKRFSGPPLRGAGPLLARFRRAERWSRARLAALGLLLLPADRLCRSVVVPVLLDDHHHHPAGQRALSSVERPELRAVLDLRIRPWSHIKDLLTETLFSTWMLNTMIISIAATAISLFCGLLAGYALSRLKFPFAGSLGTMIFITYLVPQTLLFIPLADIIRNFRLGDSPWALILTYPTFLIPFVTWLMMGYFKSIPKELEECARIDGATRWKAMVYIIFPIAVPGILSAGIFAFTLSWNEFLYALVFLSSPEQKTVPVGVTSELIRGDVFYWGELMAGALLGSIPVAFVYSFFVEHYVASLTGSVEGIASARERAMAEVIIRA